MENNQAVRLAIEESIQFLEFAPHFTMAHGEYTRRKWDGAWWHMVALYEMGEVKRIPGPLLKERYTFSKPRSGQLLLYPPMIIQQVKVIR